MLVRSLLRTGSIPSHFLASRSLASVSSSNNPLSQVDPSLHFDLFDELSGEVQDLFKQAWPTSGKEGKERGKEPSSLSLPFSASHYAQEIQERMKDHGKAKLSSFHHFCDALDSKEEALLIPDLLKSYRHKLIGTKERTASCVAKATCRADVPEVAYDVFSKRQEFALFPTVRCLNFLMYRFLIDSSSNPKASKDVLKTYRLIFHYRRTPNDLSREILFRSLFLQLEKEEKLPKLVSLLSPKAELFSSLPKKGVVQLVKTLKESTGKGEGKEEGKEKKDPLEMLKTVVELRRRYSESIPQQVLTALQ